MSSESGETSGSTSRRPSSSEDRKTAIGVWLTVIFVTAIACVIALAVTGDIHADLPEWD